MPDMEKFSVSVHFFRKKVDRTENFFVISPDIRSYQQIFVLQRSIKWTSYFKNYPAVHFCKNS